MFRIGLAAGYSRPNEVPGFETGQYSSSRSRQHAGAGGFGEPLRDVLAVAFAGQLADAVEDEPIEWLERCGIIFRRYSPFAAQSGEHAFYGCYRELFRVVHFGLDVCRLPLREEIGQSLLVLRVAS